MSYRCYKAVLLTFFLWQSPILTAEPQVGQAIPAITIEKYGELVLDTQNDEVVYAPWDSSRCFTGTPVMHAVMYLPASFDAQGTNTPYTLKLEELDKKGYHGYIRPTTILNIDEGGWGGAAMVLGPIKYSKRKYPESVLVADSNGQVHAAWDLGHDIAIMVINQDGVVQFYGEGELSAEQVEEVGRLLSQGADAIMNTDADDHASGVASQKNNNEQEQPTAPVTPTPPATQPLGAGTGGEAS